MTHWVTTLVFFGKSYNLSVLTWYLILITALGVFAGYDFVCGSILMDLPLLSGPWIMADRSVNVLFSELMPVLTAIEKLDLTPEDLMA